jgi:hypothetical protein
LALIVIAPAASAGVTEGVSPTSAATADGAVPAAAEAAAETATSAVPVEPASAAPVEAPAPSVEPAPSESAETTNVIDSTRSTVSSTLDKTAASAPVSTPPTSAAEQSVAAVTDSVSAGGTSVVAARAQTTIVPGTGPASSKPGATIAPAVKDHVATLAQSLRHDSAQRIASVRGGAAEAISPLADQLPGGPTSALPPPVHTPLDPPAVDVTPPLRGPSQVGREGSKGGLFRFPDEIRAGFFSHWDPIAAGGQPSQYSTLLPIGKPTASGPGLNRLEALGTRAATVGGGDGANRAVTGSPGGRAPWHPPLPAPAPPAAITSGSGDTFFVPFAALLALLALVAMASMRRLWEAPEFRAPNPFVCALERPG